MFQRLFGIFPGWLVGWSIGCFYGISTLGGLFYAKVGLTIMVFDFIFFFLLWFSFMAYQLLQII